MAVCDVEEAKAKAFADKFGGAAVYAGGNLAQQGLGLWFRQGVQI